MHTDFLDIHEAVNISKCDKFFCFSSVDSDEDDEEEESHSSREVRCFPFSSFCQFIII